MDLELRREQLVRDLRLRGFIATDRVAEAFLHVPREEFLPPPFRHQAYRDDPAPIGLGQTISAPHMVAIMAEALRVEPGNKVLEIGTGSGYHAAILATLVGPRGRVISVEKYAALAREARERLARLGVSNVEVVTGDGSLGWGASAPYDRVSVTCAAPRVPPPLREQLAKNGILVIPIGREPSRLIRLTVADAGTQQEDLGPCAFVPLVGAHGQPDSAPR